MILDKASFETLYYQYGPRLSAYAHRFLNDSAVAEDLIQDIFIRFWEKYKGKDSESWVPVIFTMTRKRCLDHLKTATIKRSVFVPNVRISHEEEMLFIEDLAGGVSAEDYLLMKELNKQIETIMDMLPARCREVFRMSRVDGFKNSEIAEKLGISEKAVEKHITAALKVFKSHFIKEENIGGKNPVLNILLAIISL